MAFIPKESVQKIAKRRLHGKWIARLLKAIGMTLRYELQDPYEVFSQLPHPHIYVLWHNRLACAPLWYRRLVPLSQRHSAMISASGDGELLAAAMQEFHIDAVRGSKSRGGEEALLGALHALKEGKDVTVTPDGPRGPCYVLQPGVITLAKMSGIPLIPARFELSWKWQLKTWDRFQIPFPFAKTVLSIRKPIYVSKEVSVEQMIGLLSDELGR